MARAIIIGCKLPNGLILEHPTDQATKVILQGLNASKIEGSTYMPNEVDADFWEAWKMFHAGYLPLVNGSIFEASDARDAADRAADSGKTGFESLDPKAFGVAPGEK